MKRNLWLFIFLLLSSVCMFSCSSVRHLTDGESMLVRNKVKVVDAKSPDFDNLASYVRPVTNKKFMDIFRIKTVFYDWGTPKLLPNGEYKDTKFRKFLREKIGEAPVLLDSTEITNSIDQLKIVMKQLGYFDSEVNYNVTFLGKKKKKSKVDYFVTAHDPYFISHVAYDITIPEYKRIMVIHQKDKLLHDGMQYNESVINDELTRIINLIRNEGYYYVEKSIIRCEVQYDPPDSLGHDPKTVRLTIMMKIPQNENAARYLYKYRYHNNYVCPDQESMATQTTGFDTTYYRYTSRRDTSNFFFIEELKIDGKVLKPYFSYKTLANAIYTYSGDAYTQMARTSSSRGLSSLDNFDYVSILFREDESLLDTVNKTGYLDVIYQMIRKKQHSVGGQIELRNDKSDISLTYTNRNIFKGAEHLSINLSGGYYYYSLNNLFRNNTYSYPEFGISVKLDIPNRILLFNRHIRDGAVSKSTAFNFGVNYSGLYRRLVYNASLTYRWTPSYYISHSFSPIDVSTINNSDKRITYLLNYDKYPDSYQNKFGKFMLFSTKYTFNYLVPKFVNSRKHNMNLNISGESSGLLLKGLNALFSPKERWVIGQNGLDSTGYDYTTFEKVEVMWNYTYSIDKENAVAMRADIGVMIPLDKESYVPYEKGFYMGTSNSMRGWGYRGLGPGSYKHGSDTLYTGDIKMEFNLEYRGTIYRSIKYGIFADVGNIWLSRKEADMPGAEFSFQRFYKELAFDAGVGLRLDFDFFVIRLDWAIPIYDPTRVSEQGYFINKRWFNPPHAFRLFQGLKLAIGYAF